MAKIIQFPSKITPLKVKAEMHRNRIDELEIENQYINDDIDYLTAALKKNRDELAEVLKQLAIMNGEAGVHQADFENEWGDDFEFTPDFEIKDEETMDKVAETMADAAKKLEDAVNQLVLDLNINPENEDK